MSDKLILAEDKETGHIYPVREDAFNSDLYKKVPGPARDANGNPVAPIVNLNVGTKKAAEHVDSGQAVVPTGPGGSK